MRAARTNECNEKDAMNIQGSITGYHSRWSWAVMRRLQIFFRKRRSSCFGNRVQWRGAVKRQNIRQNPSDMTYPEIQSCSGNKYLPTLLFQLNCPNTILGFLCHFQPLTCNNPANIFPLLFWVQILMLSVIVTYKWRVWFRLEIYVRVSGRNKDC